MRLLICSADTGSRKLTSFLRKSGLSDADVEILSPTSFSRSVKTKARGAFVYFFLPELGERKALALAAKLSAVEDLPWGVIDCDGEAEDPAAFFFAGARDYIGPRLFKKGAQPKRLARAATFAMAQGSCSDDRGAQSFAGWDTLAEGEQFEARFCYAALADQEGLRERIGEIRLGKLKDEFASFLESWSKESGGILWIREAGGCLLLFPPTDAQTNPILSAFKLLLDRMLIGYEVFRLQVPLSFRFAFHAGRAPWRKRGATGTVVSDDVNYVFHLGQRTSSDGLIVVSEKAEKSIPPCLRDLFSRAGSFEGRQIHVSRRFSD